MHAMLYYSSDQPERYHGRNLDAAYHRFAHRHRVELVHAYDEARLEAAWDRFSGADFTRERRYEGPGTGAGNRVVPRSFYGPGRDFDDRIAGPIGTVQLANFRRGLQDHQYLSMARALGLNSVVDEVLTAIVPRVFSDAGERVSFPEAGAPYEAARLRLARAISGAVRSGAQSR